MKNQKGIRVAVVGLGFGSSFVPIYLDHPDVESVTICDANPDRLNKVGNRFNVKKRAQDVSEIVKADDLDAVHLLSGIPDHARQTIALLKAGKHCACAVPMATSIVDLKAIVAAQRSSKKNYIFHFLLSIASRSADDHHWIYSPIAIYEILESDIVRNEMPKEHSAESNGRTR